MTNYELKQKRIWYNMVNMAGENREGRKVETIIYALVRLRYAYTPGRDTFSIGRLTAKDIVPTVRFMLEGAGRGPGLMAHSIDVEPIDAELAQSLLVPREKG